MHFIFNTQNIQWITVVLYLIVVSEQRIFENFGDHSKNKGEYFITMAENDYPDLHRCRGEPVEIKTRNEVQERAPPKALSAFFWFTNDERSKVRAEHPEYNLGDTAKELGRRWLAASPEVIAKYEAIAQEDIARYERERDAYNQKRMTSNS